MKEKTLVASFKNAREWGRRGKSYMFVNLWSALATLRLVYSVFRPAFSMLRPVFARLRSARATSTTTDQSQTVEKDTLGEIIIEKELNVCFL